MTPRKIDSKAQPQRETWLASFPEKNPNPILEITLEGRIEYTNPAIRKLFPTLEEQQIDHPYLANWGEVVEPCLNQPDFVISRVVRVGDEYYQQSIHFVSEIQRLRVYGMDITERKKKETEAQQLAIQLEVQRQVAQNLAAEAQQRADELDATFTALAEAVMVYDASGKIRRANPAAVRTLGFDPTQMDIPGLNGKVSTRNSEGRLVQPDETPTARALKGVTVIGERFSLTNAAGREIHTINSSSPLWKNGQVYGAVAVWRDVTEREQLLQDTQHRATELDTIITAIADGVVIYDKDGNITRMNPKAEKILGYSPAERDLPYHKRAAKVLQVSTDEGHPITQPQVLPAFRALQGETVDNALFESRHFRTGKKMWTLVSAAPLRTAKGEIFGAVVTTTDITGRKQEEILNKALNQIHRSIHSHHRFDQIMQQILTEAAKAVESDTAAISLHEGGNWKVAYVYGFPQEVVGTVMNNDEERHAFLAIQTQQPVVVQDAFEDERFNREHLRKWGIRSVLVVPILLKNEANGVLFFNYQQAVHPFQEMHLNFGRQLAASISLALENYRLIEDLQEELSVRIKTEEALRRNEQQLREMNEHLEQRVRERTQALEMALDTEKSLRSQLIRAEKNAALARLLKSVAHEINNPLQTVKNSLFLLAPEIPAGELHEILEMAISDSRRIGALVQQLHETYQFANSQPVEFNLMEVITKVKTLLGPQSQKNRVEWHTWAETDCLLIQGIPDQIEQVCLNICINAIDAMGPKGGRLTVNVIRTHPDKVCISFQDTGPGIPDTDQGKIFEPFFTTKEKGLGLGLAICHEIMTSHQGEITLESKMGKGTTFSLLLPAK